MNQRGVWESIAQQWQKFRAGALPEIQGYLKNRKGLILDLGCGAGRNFFPGKRYVGVDFSASMLGFSKQHADKNKINAILIKADLTRLPLKADVFDTVLMVAALHVVEDRNGAVKEMKRVMHAGGEAVIEVWNRGQPRFALAKKESFISWRCAGKTYWRYYYLFTARELRKFLSKYFIIRKIYGSKEKAFKLFPKNIIAVVRKP